MILASYPRYTSFFLHIAPATPDIYTLSLHDALPISMNARFNVTFSPNLTLELFMQPLIASGDNSRYKRSEEHTSELQSPYDLVCRLLLEKKYNKPSVRVLLELAVADSAQRVKTIYST